MEPRGVSPSHVVSSNKDIKPAVLWAPVTHPVMTYSPLLGSGTVLKASRSEDTEVFVSVTNWGDEIKLKAPFFKEVFSYNPIGAITNYRGPLLVIIGSKDDLVVDVNSWMKYHEGNDKLVELSTDHVWDIFLVQMYWITNCYQRPYPDLKRCNKFYETTVLDNV